MKKVFHGSMIDIQGEYLKPCQPFKRSDYDERVYFTSSKILALIYSVSPIRAYAENKHLDKSEFIPAFRAHVRIHPSIEDCGNKQITCYELYNGMFDELFNRKSYIYECKLEGDYKEDRDDCCWVDHEVFILKKREIGNALKEMEKIAFGGSFKLVKYYDISDEDRRFLIDQLDAKAAAIESMAERQFFEQKLATNFPSVLTYLKKTDK